MGEGRRLKRLAQQAAYISSLEPDFERLSDAELAAKTVEFKQRIERGESIEELVFEAYAAVREAAKRSLGMRPFDVQLMGAIVLHERDTEWMGPVYEALGLRATYIRNMMPFDERKAAYEADITYGTNSEFGFDYLRDNMASRLEYTVQRGHSYAIVDEVDSILIDEARTPLIISGQPETAARTYYDFARVAKTLSGVQAKFVPKGEIKTEDDADYEYDEKFKTVSPRESAIEKVERALGVDNLYDPRNAQLVNHLIQSLKAQSLYQRDVDYVVQDGEVKIVDEFTGRIMEGRRWSEGLHQAVEAKEFVEIYDLNVVEIPTNRPVARDDRNDLIFKTKDAKFDAVVDDIAERHERGQPVLVGTIAVETSEYLSQRLTRSGVPHEVLNAKQHEREAMIIAQAGRKHAVTIATNMAGRGVDIVLGGNPEAEVRQQLEARGIDAESEEFEPELKRRTEEAK